MPEIQLKHIFFSVRDEERLSVQDQIEQQKLRNTYIAIAQCGYSAGRGLRESCKHIAALRYALEEFTRLKHLHHPTPQKLQPIPAEKPVYTYVSMKSCHQR